MKVTFWATLLILQVFLFSCNTDTTTPDQTDARLTFVGVWSVNENWTKLSYEVSITTDAATTDGVYIENFAGSGAGVKTHAKISGSSITIIPTPQALSNGWSITSGSGSMEGTTKINWNYVFNDEANTYTAVAVYTKK